MDELDFGTTDGMLDAIERYADYWFGRRNIRDVFAFLVGHRVARLFPGSTLTAADDGLDAFQDWISDFIKLEPDESWPDALERQAGSADGAFELLFDLYRQYKAARENPPAP